jgi:predicted Zn-ribbon and HTH transcriptional regulator
MHDWIANQIGSERVSTPMRCTKCPWTGPWHLTVGDGETPDRCPDCKAVAVDANQPFSEEELAEMPF